MKQMKSRSKLFTCHVFIIALIVYIYLVQLQASGIICVNKLRASCRETAGDFREVSHERTR